VDTLGTEPVRLTDWQTFLAAMLAAPGDQAPILVFCDWLEERGDPGNEAWWPRQLADRQPSKIKVHVDLSSGEEVSGWLWGWFGSSSVSLNPRDRLLLMWNESETESIESDCSESLVPITMFDYLGRDNGSAMIWSGTVQTDPRLEVKGYASVRDAYADLWRGVLGDDDVAVAARHLSKTPKVNDAGWFKELVR
jgi:uncharacterized protein (TIGR02996 family)